MTTTPRFVIVIPTKNRRALLPRAIRSVLSQEYSYYRIVIINDGSTDETRDYLDTLPDERIKIFHHKQSRGVNAARNVALRTLTEDEWAIFLDDDDALLPDALTVVASRIKTLPPEFEVLGFNTVTHTNIGDTHTGWIFREGEEWYDPSFDELIIGSPMHNGDSRSVFKWTLFPKHLFSEDVNGFEGEWSLKAVGAGTRLRLFPDAIIWIDAAHTGEHLSAVAGQRDPASFVRVHKRIFHAHAGFLKDHPKLAMQRASTAFKLALRAFDPFSAIYFAGIYARALLRTL